MLDILRNQIDYIFGVDLNCINSWVFDKVLKLEENDEIIFYVKLWYFLLLGLEFVGFLFFLVERFLS